jgi:hypothetical protein
MPDVKINKDPDDEDLKTKAREVARDKYETDDCQIYETDAVDLDCEGGCWVTAQVWVSDADLGLEDA